MSIIRFTTFKLMELKVKYQKILVCGVLLLSLPALATDPKPSTSASPSSNASSVSGASSYSSAASQSAAVGIGSGGDAHATGGQATGGQSSAVVNGVAGGNATGGNGGTATQNQNATGGNSSQTQSANNAGNAQSTTITSNHREVRQAPSINAPTVFASGPCAYGWSAGVSSPVGGISGGRAKADTNCDRREAARVLMAVNPALALKVLCSDPLVAAVATGDDCVYQPPAVTEQVNGTPPPDLSNYATKDELNRVFKKSQSK